MNRNNKWKNSRKNQSSSIANYYLDRVIVQEMFRMLKNTNLEIGGTIIGYEDNNNLYGVAVIFPPNTERTGTFCSFMPKELTRIAKEVFNIIETFSPDHNFRIISWVHTHPNMGTFLSGTDVETYQRLKRVFPSSAFVSVVVDPIRGDVDWFKGPNSDYKVATIQRDIHLSTRDIMALSQLSSNLAKYWLAHNEDFVIVVKPSVLSLATENFARQFNVRPSIALPTVSVAPSTQQIKKPISKPTLDNELSRKIDQVMEMINRLSLTSTESTTSQPVESFHYTVPSDFSEAYNYMIQGMQQTIQGLNTGFQTIALSTKAFIDTFDSINRSQHQELQSVQETLRTSRDEINSKLQNIYENTDQKLEATHNQLIEGLTRLNNSILEKLNTLTTEQQNILTTHISKFSQEIQEKLQAFTTDLSSMIDNKISQLSSSVENNNNLFESLTQELSVTRKQFEEMMSADALTKINNIYSEIDKMTEWGNNFNEQMQTMSSTLNELSSSLEKWKTDVESLWQIAEGSEVIFEKHFEPLDLTEINIQTSIPAVNYLLLTKSKVVVEYKDSKHRLISTGIEWDTIKELLYRRLDVEEQQIYAFEFKGKTKLHCVIRFENDDQAKLVLSKLKAYTPKMIKLSN